MMQIPVSLRSLCLLATVLCVALLTSALPAHAQFGLSDPGSALSIVFTPATPHPGEAVTVSVKSSLLDIRDSDILWEASGKKIAQGKGASSAQVTAGALGAETTVAVTAAAQDGTIARTEAVIRPTELDLLVDSDSYIPPFYRGAPRPSAGTSLRLQAIPRFKRGNAMMPAGDLIYTWRRNGEIIGNISGRGRLAAVIPVEHIFGTDLISVEVRSADDRFAQVSSASISAQEPVLALYEDHPLYGVLYHRALSNTTAVPGAEATFAAVPFFAQARSIYDPALQFDWRVNSADIPANLKNPGELTINAENSSGIAFIELAVTHATNFFFEAKGAWSVTFSSPWSGSSDQFRNVTQ